MSNAASTVCETALAPFCTVIANALGALANGCGVIDLVCVKPLRVGVKTPLLPFITTVAAPAGVITTCAGSNVGFP